MDQTPQLRHAGLSEGAETCPVPLPLHAVSPHRNLEGSRSPGIPDFAWGVYRLAPRNKLVSKPFEETDLGYPAARHAGDCGILYVGGNAGMRRIDLSNPGSSYPFSSDEESVWGP